MSERGWQDFLAADGVDDWVVLHGGATAVFRSRVASRGSAAGRGARARSRASKGSGAVLTITDAHLTVRLTRDMWQLEPRHIELARAVSSRRADARCGRRPGAAAGGPARDLGEARRDRPWLLARRPRVRADGRRQRGRPPRSRVDGLDAGARRRPSRWGTRCTSTCRSRASTPRHELAAALAAGGRMVDEVGGAGRLDPGRPRRQQGLHRGVAGWCQVASRRPC